MVKRWPTHLKQDFLGCLQDTTPLIQVLINYIIIAISCHTVNIVTFILKLSVKAFFKLLV